MKQARLEDLIGGGETDPEWAKQPEAERMETVRAFGAVPDACGWEIPAAVARGPFRALHLEALYPTGKGGFEAKPAGYRSHATMVLSMSLIGCRHRRGAKGRSWR